MTTLDNILSIEAVNESAIYLYEHGDKWFAYEHSAYNFLLTFKMGEIVRLGSSISIAISNQLDFLHSKAMGTVEVSSVADTVLKIDCATAFSGFEQWKQEQLR